MSTLVRFFITIVITTTISVPAFSEERILPIDLTASQINVAVSSQIISTTAQLKKFTGSMTLDPKDVSAAKIVVGSKGSDVALAKMPIDQMFLVSGLLSAVTNESMLFESQSLEPKGEHGKYILNGVATSGKHRDKISIPVTILPTSKNADRFQLTANYTRSGPVGKKDSVQGAMFGDVKADGDIRLVFGR